MAQGKFAVVATYTRDGIVERTERHSFDSMVPAFAKWGELCATSNGAIIFSTDDFTVWAEHNPRDYSFRRMNDADRRRYQLWLERAP